MTKDLSIPVQFELGSALEDDRFLKVKIFIAHTGENLNKSVFSKDVLANMAETLSGVPIVGYIKQDEQGNEDFDDHKTVIKVKNNDVDIFYAGHAYGFIPKENNFSFEIRGGKEWLTCEGIVWTKFKDSISILLDGGGVKSQSMEIEVNESFVDNQGRINYTDARFSGLCILGDDVPPGMAGSTIEIFSKKTQFFSEIQEMISEFYAKEDSDLSKEKEKVEVEKFEEIEATEEVVEAQEEVQEVEESTEEVIETEEQEVEETENVEEDETEEDTEEATEEFAEDETGSEDKSEILSKENFALSHEALRQKISSEVLNIEEDADWAYTLQTFDDYAVVEVEKWSEVDGYSYITKMYDYTKDNEEVALSNGREVFPTYLTKTEVEQVDLQREEIKALREQLSVYEIAEKESKVVEYAEILGKKADEIRAKFSELSIEEVEKEVGYACFQLTKDKDANGKASVNAVNFNRKEPNKAIEEYGELARYFNK